jgi:hypothetical protein
MRWTEDQLADHLKRTGVRGSSTRVDVSKPPFKMPGNQAGAFALGRLPTGTMNKTEAAYDAYLRGMTSVGEVLWHKFEGVKLRLAENTFLTVDFAVLTKECALEMHEVKGFWQDDARVKIKVAASIYPFKFIAVKKAKGGGWEREEFS